MEVLIVYSLVWCLFCLVHAFPRLKRWIQRCRDKAAPVVSMLPSATTGECTAAEPFSIATLQREMAVWTVCAHAFTVLVSAVCYATIWALPWIGLMGGGFVLLDLCLLQVARRGSLLLLSYVMLGAWLLWPFGLYLLESGNNNANLLGGIVTLGFVGVLSSNLMGVPPIHLWIFRFAQSCLVTFCLIWQTHWNMTEGDDWSTRFLFCPIIAVSTTCFLDKASSLFDLFSLSLDEIAMLLDRIDTLEQSNINLKDKAGCVSSLAHEVRTPLNALLACCTLLGDTVLTQEQQEYVTLMMTCGAQITNNIDYVLELARLEEKKVILENKPFNVYEMCMNCVSMVKHLAEKKKLELKVECSPSFPAVCGDPNRLKQALINLLSNSIKFTEVGSVTLAAKVVEMRGPSQGYGGAAYARVRFEIRDTGIGISEEQEAKLFKPFGQANESVWSKFGGSGLGLMISQQLLCLMNGTIGIDRARTAVGVGSCFVIDIQLPLEVERENGEPARQNGFPVGSSAALLSIPNSPHVPSTSSQMLLDTQYFSDSISPANSPGLSPLPSAPPPSSSKRLSIVRIAPPTGIAYSATGRINASATLSNIRKLHESMVPLRMPTVPPTFFENSTTPPRQHSTDGGGELEPAQKSDIPKITFTDHPRNDSSLASLPATGSTLAHGRSNSHASATSQGSLVLPGISSVVGGMMPRQRSKEMFSAFSAMVVDDSTINLMVMCRLLQSIGFSSVIKASDGRDAVAKFNSNPQIHFILTDLSMPEMDGYELAKTIRTITETNGTTYPSKDHPTLRWPVIVAVTGAVEIENSECKANIDAFVSKPITRPQLQNLATRWLIERETSMPTAGETLFPTDRSFMVSSSTATGAGLTAAIEAATVASSGFSNAPSMGSLGFGHRAETKAILRDIFVNNLLQQQQQQQLQVPALAVVPPPPTEEEENRPVPAHLAHSFFTGLNALRGGGSANQEDDPAPKTPISVGVGDDQFLTVEGIVVGPSTSSCSSAVPKADDPHVGDVEAPPVAATAVANTGPQASTSQSRKSGSQPSSPSHQQHYHNGLRPPMAQDPRGVNRIYSSTRLLDSRSSGSLFRNNPDA